MAKAIEECGFAILDAAVFLHDHGLGEWSYEAVVQALISALAAFPQRIDLSSDADDLLKLSAAYGEIYHKFGAQWVWLGERYCLQLPNRLIPPCPIIIDPLSSVFRTILFGGAGYIRSLIERDLEFTGNG